MKYKLGMQQERFKFPGAAGNVAGQPRAWFSPVSAEGHEGICRKLKLREWALASFLFQNAQGVKFKLLFYTKLFMADPNLIQTRNGRRGDHPAWFREEFSWNSHLLKGHKEYFEICSGSLGIFYSIEYFLQFCTWAFNSHCTFQELKRTIHLQKFREKLE